MAPFLSNQKHRFVTGGEKILVLGGERKGEEIFVLQSLRKEALRTQTSVSTLQSIQFY